MGRYIYSAEIDSTHVSLHMHHGVLSVVSASCRISLDLDLTQRTWRS
jgi:hypothetical protein